METKLEFKLFIKPGNVDVETLTEFFSSLSSLQRASGGLGLEFEELPLDRYDANDKELKDKGYFAYLARPVQ